MPVSITGNTPPQLDPFWRRIFRRLLNGAFAILFVAALSVILQRHPEVWRPIWHWMGDPELKEWSTIVQIVGAIVTACGLANAYLRGWAARIKFFLGTLGRIGVFILIGAIGGKRQAAFFATQRFVAEEFALDPITPNYKQIMQLNDFMNGIARQVSRIDGNVVSLAKNVEQFWDKNQSDMREMQKALVKDQGVDLGWAIVGLIITTIGLIMSYGT